MIDTKKLVVPDEWKVRWLLKAYDHASRSPDPSTQNGAIIMQKYVNQSWECISAGCNEFPEGVENTPERLVRPLKYQVVEHAERSAIYNAAKKGRLTCNAVMIAPWFACADCARAIIRAGIGHVIGHKQVMDKTSSHPSWVESINLAFKMLDEAGVTYEFYDGFLDAPQVLFNGEYWKP